MWVAPIKGDVARTESKGKGETVPTLEELQYWLLRLDFSLKFFQPSNTISAGTPQ